METKKQEIDLNLILAFPIVFILGVIPLVVHFKILPLPEAVKVVWGEKDIDMFSYYKSMMILGSTLMLLIGLIIKTLQDKRIKIPACFYPMFVYLIFVILSAVFSSYGFISMWGVPSRYEGVLVLVSYVVIMVATANIVVEEKQIKLLLGALFISAGLIGIIGVFQYFGLDFFRSEFAKCVILPSNLRNMNIQFNFGKNIIYSTLFNPNNVGSYAAMLFPVSLCFYIFIRQKWPKVLLGVFSCLMFIVWIGCQSLMGNIGGCFALALMVTLWGKKIVSRYRSLLIVIVAYVIIFFIMNFSSSGSLIHNAAKIKGLGSNDFVIDVKQEKISDLTIVTQKSGLKISYDKGKLEFFDIDGKYLSYSSKVANGKQDEEKLVIDDKAYYSYDIKMQNINNDNLRLCIDKSGVNFDLILTKMGIGFVDSRGYGNPQSKVEMIDIKGKEAYGSGRFYIWSRSIPLIKKTLLIGNGPDTFTYYFPQNDFIGKIKGLFNQKFLIDKPHNMYLGMAINTGVVSLVAFIIFILMYYVSTIRLLWKKDIDNIWMISAASILAAVTGYLFAAIGNDSIVSVAPVFWVLIGLGIAININLKGSNRSPENDIDTEI